VPDDFGTAIASALGYSYEFGLILASGTFSALNQTTIKLEDLNTPGVVEHRASITRLDAEQGDSAGLDAERLALFLDDAVDGAFTVGTMGATRVRVEKLTPPPALGAGELSASLGEAALILLTMTDGPIPDVVEGDISADLYAAISAPAERVAAWMSEERFPTELGWKPATRVVELADLSPITQLVTEAQKELEAAE
jgi:hypothetical protein